jgi:5-methyltetrahydropteroyltriglutamate--homocysteine methyltransferase
MAEPLPPDLLPHSASSAIPSARPALPPIPTMGIGSYAAPGWLIAGRRHAREEFGPDDLAEMFDDATRIAVADQLEAGLDIVSDGELARQRFVFEMFSHLSGLARVTPGRRLGIAGYDMAPHFRADIPVTAPAGLGTVEELQRLRRIAPTAHLKVALPGPLTFAAFMERGSRPAVAVLDDLAGIVRAELEALVSAGADYVQLDEPGLTKAPFGLTLGEAIGVLAPVLAGLPARRSVHLCFGNNAGRPMADRRLAPYIEPLLQLPADEVSVELANREMADVERLADLAARFDIAAGVVDVKSFEEETAERVAERLEACLAHVPVARLRATADCGFSALPRWLARRKIEALVAGTRLVRRRHGLTPGETAGR